MSDHSAWVGCAAFEGYRLNGGTLELARSHPFGVEGSVGTVVHQFAGDLCCGRALQERLEPSAQIVAQLTSGRQKMVGAYTNTYGKGRIYFQYLTYHPNSPSLNDLFIGGVKWAAGLVDLDGRSTP